MSLAKKKPAGVRSTGGPREGKTTQMLCTELSVVWQATAGIKCEPLYCRSWGCEICAPRRARRLRYEARRGKPTTFLTLTANPAWGQTPDARARRLVEAWRNIRQAWSRENSGQKLPFLAVFEATRAGEPHLHIIMRAPFIKQSWLSGLMAKYMQSPIVDIRRVQSQRGVAKYIAKYIAKAPKVFEGCKRYWRSLDWFDVADPPLDNGLTFLAVIRRNYYDVCEDVRRHGLTFAECVSGGAIRVSWWTGTYMRY